MSRVCINPTCTRDADNTGAINGYCSSSCLNEHRGGYSKFGQAFASADLGPRYIMHRMTPKLIELTQILHSELKERDARLLINTNYLISVAPNDSDMYPNTTSIVVAEGDKSMPYGIDLPYDEVVALIKGE